MVRLQILPDPGFTKDGLDIVSHSEISMAQAALGCELDVKTIYGGYEKVRVDAGTNSGEQVVIVGKVERRG